ncbi:hypothetical protein KC19_VG271600 [Ceratodon purpureus]|uniref:Ammonium transporter AmtB-like domain-containing protein n=1 Tax=Ceratodon purpureus TaxID=3225 RepID=A0A8T0HV15_CERPU|nr:hypothetical protein KC19_VG271600 [Ceratodon purpureus]
MWLHKRWWLLQNVDDTLGVLHTHSVAGILGGICVMLCAEPKLCEYMDLVVTNSNGPFYGGEGGVQVLKQIIGAAYIVETVTINEETVTIQAVFTIVRVCWRPRNFFL